MSTRSYIVGTSSTRTDLTWEEKNNGPYLLKEDVVRDLQNAVTEARKKLGEQQHKEED